MIQTGSTAGLALGDLLLTLEDGGSGESAEGRNRRRAVDGRRAWIVVEPVDGGIRCTVSAAGDHCTDAGGGGDHAGIHIPVNGLRAARFDFTLIDPENIVGFYVYAQTDNHGSIRWRWELDRAAQQFGFAGTVTLVPG